MENRWLYLVILGVFILISWGVRVVLSQQVSDRVLDEEGNEKE
jgi:hypothetical protein